MLRKNGVSIEQLAAITADYHQAGLEPAEVAMLVYAQKIVRRAGDVTAGDVAALREHGFSDAEILDIALAAAARCFFSKTLDAVGAEPDEAYAELASALHGLLPPA